MMNSGTEQTVPTNTAAGVETTIPAAPPGSGRGRPAASHQTGALG